MKRIVFFQHHGLSFSNCGGDHGSKLSSDSPGGPSAAATLWAVLVKTRQGE
jgi:hypothetical protein